jgi:hypothetical protein
LNATIPYQTGVLKLSKDLISEMLATGQRTSGDSFLEVDPIPLYGPEITIGFQTFVEAVWVRRQTHHLLVPDPKLGTMRSMPRAVLITIS